MKGFRIRIFQKGDKTGTFSGKFRSCHVFHLNLQIVYVKLPAFRPAFLLGGLWGTLSVPFLPPDIGLFSNPLAAPVS